MVKGGSGGMLGGEPAAVKLLREERPKLKNDVKKLANRGNTTEGA